MIKTGLALDDKQLAEEARRMQLGKINTKNPYKKEKKKKDVDDGKMKEVKYFQDPRKIDERIKRFRKQCTLDHTENQEILEKWEKHLKDDEFIDETFSSHKDDGEQDDFEKDDDDLEEREESPSYLRQNTSGAEQELCNEIGDKKFTLMRLQTFGFTMSGSLMQKQ